MAARCREQVRQPLAASQRAVAKAGWLLYSAAQTDGTVTVLMAMSGVDGMCRPMAYQAFVFWQGRYAGTLSPVPMNSRSDGSLTSVNIASGSSITATFARYLATDPLCCPSNLSTVSYEVRDGERPLLVPIRVATRSAGEADREAQTNRSSLFGTRWRLTRIAGQLPGSDHPNVQFDRKPQRVSGDTGCNRFFGRFSVEGSSLRILDLEGTRRACLSTRASRLEAQFLQSLGSVTRFEIEQRILRLFNGDRALVEFTSE
jgi:heat shock protein HslJ